MAEAGAIDSFNAFFTEMVVGENLNCWTLISAARRPQVGALDGSLWNGCPLFSRPSSFRSRSGGVNSQPNAFA
ncbi:hypothetical protein ADM99_03150 [Leptolinea tardivitalis]|uniref:Uncharacterized protein n=1 Tax=Leptolinea tardivitalis TaxID=229920 RepID=A0A0N8GLR6_9CHLR|nr:hypothetical protein ADM99_03150 [Leptolinea tardivitalis]